jgi:hypothetical protein
MGAFVMLRRLTNGIVDMEYVQNVKNVREDLKFFNSELQHLEKGYDHMTSLIVFWLRLSGLYIYSYFIESALSILCEN